MALSYTWGLKPPSVPIIINGHIKLVSENLYLALLHLRQRRYKTVWIDALCINQDDLQERAAQVTRMKDIYKQAFLVYIWLGDSDRFTTRGFESLPRMLGHAHMETIEPQKFFDSNTLIPQRMEIFRSISEILYRPWFRRMWVIQEVLAAREAVMACGNDTLSVGAFLDTIKFMMRAGALRKVISRHPSRPELADGGPLMRATKQLEFLVQATHRDFKYRGLKRTLLNLLAVSRWAEATDPRDKVYGILSMAEDIATLGYWNKGKWVPFKVDYTVSKETVFINVAKSILSVSQSLDILFFAGKSEREGNGLPSWVPNWANQNPEPVSEYIPVDSGKEQYSEMNSSLWRPVHECLRTPDCVCEINRRITLRCRALFTLGVNDTLAATGIHYDTITGVSKESWPSKTIMYKADFNSSSDIMADMDTYLGLIQEWLEDCTQISTRCSPYPTGELTSEVLWKLLRAGSISEDAPELPPSDGHLGIINAIRATFAFARAKYYSTDSSESELADGIDIDTPADVLSKKDIESFLPQVMDILPPYSTKKFAATKKKYMGLVPPNARAGDLICIMYGCEIPFILRRCGRRNVFEFVGHGHFHGINFDDVVVESNFQRPKPREAARPFDMKTHHCRTNRVTYTKFRETRKFTLI